MILNSALPTFVPLYSKAEQIAEGGASPYDTSTLFNPQTKTPSNGPVAGAKKALQPFRTYNNPQAPERVSPNGWSARLKLRLTVL